MQVLVFGGTRFVGRHIVEALLARGHGVSVFSRGAGPDPLPGTVERLRGDRNDSATSLAALDGRRWDACVDVSGYTPRQVRPSAERLASAVGRYLFISTVSVYAEAATAPVLEADALLPEAAEDVTEITPGSYGPLKVTCERIVRDLFDDRCTILRPQIVAGPYDPTGRYTYWVQRAAQGGALLAPGTGRDHVQVVDARDMARFTVRALERGLGGIFNMAGPRLTWADFMDALGAQTPVWVEARVLEAEGLTFTDLPLFLPDGAPHSRIMDVSAERASHAGFTWTDPRRTVAETHAWLREHPMTPVLTAERERAVLAAART
jgi:2'-hydroxyisoflavone reductase